MASCLIFKVERHLMAHISFQLTSAFVSVKIQLEWYEIDNDGGKMTLIYKIIISMHR